MERETELKVIEVNLKCPDCESLMNNVGPATSEWFSKSGSLLYKCSRCGTTSVSDKVYPYKKYVPK